MLEAVIARAESKRAAVGLYVDPMNPRAFELYRSLGFKAVGDQNQMYVEMRLNPRVQSA